MMKQSETHTVNLYEVEIKKSVNNGHNGRIHYFVLCMAESLNAAKDSTDVQAGEQCFLYRIRLVAENVATAQYCYRFISLMESSIFYHTDQFTPCPTYGDKIARGVPRKG